MKDIIIGIIGVISGILCARADVPLAWSGIKGDAVDAKSVGRISVWWTKVDDSHFDKAFWLSCIGQPGTYLTMWALADIVSERSELLGLFMKICTFIGAYTGLLFHAAACIKPMVYLRIANEVTPETAQAAMDAIDRYPKIPSLISAVFLMLGSTVLTVTAILNGSLDDIRTVQSRRRSAFYAACKKARLEDRRLARDRVCTSWHSAHSGGCVKVKERSK